MKVPTFWQNLLISKQYSNISYLGECHCQNDFLEHYDEQDRLHCYEENSRGPCENGKVFVQPDEEEKNGVLKNPICSDDCQNNYLRYYDDQNRLYCYEENSQGPCENGNVFIQPIEEDENGALKDPTCSKFVIRDIFGHRCNYPNRRDSSGNCRPTHVHRNRPCDLECLRRRRRRG